MSEGFRYRSPVYAYLRADGVPVAHPLFQGEGGGANPTSALQLRFDRVQLETALELNALWHSAMPDLTPFGARNGIYSESFVAEFDGGWYATAIWSSPPALNRFKVDPEEIIELRRFAVGPHAPRNTASRMLGWMVRELKRDHPQLKRFCSYQAEQIHKGTIYRAAGWKPVYRREFRDGWLPGGGSSASNHRPSRSSQVQSAKIRWEVTR